MTQNKMILVVGALAMTLGVGSLSAAAGQRGNRSDRSGGEARSQSRERPEGQRAEGGAVRTARPRDQQESAPAARDNAAQHRDDARQGDQRPAARNDGNDGRRAEPARPQVRGNVYRYEAPRAVPRVYAAPAPRRNYGPRTRLELHFGFGSGYRYGAPYSGRVYGYYRPGPAYGRYFGDVRLQVRPRDAAVYVDGYFAGIVDDFDGIFQRLTLEVGPHQIEIEAPGYEPRSFDVYVDPSHTVDVRSDLYPDGRY